MENITDEPFELLKCDSGALRFHMKSALGSAVLSLIAHGRPDFELYQIFLGPVSRVIYFRNPSQSTIVQTPQISTERQLQEFWITWFNGVIRVGLGDQVQPFLNFNTPDKKRDAEDDLYIGFVKFYIHYGTGYVEWYYESPPVIEKIMKFKGIEGGKLRWVQLVNNQLPQDALIGGFEYEPIYIARSRHNGSLCPGKYVPSLKLAFVPWGHREHSKTSCEILCGYDAKWVKTINNHIPENAFIGGTSEVYREPLYIGRAMIEGHLIIGKVHVLYKTCYLPHNGIEYERQKYEILVRCDYTPQGIECPIKEE